ncbi:MAG: TetR/AcrR family transcriptional regulator [Vulcanimicrobiaceae bacterium]
MHAIEAARGTDATRRRILAATRELYARGGSSGTTTLRIAERAGVNEATVFRHFGTKGRLIAEMLERYAGDSVAAEAIGRARALGSLEEQLEAMARGAVEALRAREDLIKVTMAEEYFNPDGFSCAWRGPVRTREAFAAYFAEQIAAGRLRGDPDMLARTFMSLYFAFVVARKLWSDNPVPNDVAIRSLIDIFLHGARNR